jgi:hypothetical protein
MLVLNGKAAICICIVLVAGGRCGITPSSIEYSLPPAGIISNNWPGGRCQGKCCDCWLCRQVAAMIVTSRDQLVALWPRFGWPRRYRMNGLSSAVGHPMSSINVPAIITSLVGGAPISQFLTELASLGPACRCCEMLVAHCGRV